VVSPQRVEFDRPTLRAVQPKARMAARLLLFALLIAAATWSPRASAARVHVLPIVFRLATRGGEPVVADAFLASRLERASAIFAPYGVRFAEAGRHLLDEGHAQLETRDDRDALGRYAQRGAIDCFVVASLRDVDEPQRMRRGVHWHSRSYLDAHFVILSAIAGPDVLAHELGHYLGNPKHSEGPDNLMSYARTRPDPILDPSQLARMKVTLGRYLRTGELRAVKQ
jgi:hypothetical protein